MNPEELSEALRHGSGIDLFCRRGVVVTSFVAIGCMLLIALYQFGILRHLPNLPLPRMNAEKVDAAPEAYNQLGLPMPDAFLGLVSYAVTAALAAFGPPGRYDRWMWWIVPIFGAKVVIDAIQAGKLSWLQWAEHRAFCIWCLVAALAAFIALPLAAVENWQLAKIALRR